MAERTSFGIYFEYLLIVAASKRVDESGLIRGVWIGGRDHGDELVPFGVLRYNATVRPLLERRRIIIDIFHC